jgi:hypothetical protein
MPHQKRTTAVKYAQTLKKLLNHVHAQLVSHCLPQRLQGDAATYSVQPKVNNRARQCRQCAVHIGCCYAWRSTCTVALKKELPQLPPSVSMAAAVVAVVDRAGRGELVGPCWP